jgi:hypothetical protein
MKNLKTILTSLALIVIGLGSTTTFASGADSAEEMLTRFQTERLSTAQKISLVQEALHPLDLRDRIIFYSVALGKLGENGIPQANTDPFFLEALGDLKQVPRGMFSEQGICGFGDNQALGCFAGWSMTWAMSNIGMSPSVARQYVVDFFKMPWLDTIIVQSVALSVGRNKNQQYPYLHFIVTQLLQTHFALPADYDSQIAFDILGSVRYKTYSNGMTDFTSYGFSYKESIWILDTVMKQGKMSAAGRKGLAELRHEFELGAEFEAQAGAGAHRSSNPADINHAADVMKQMILKSGQAPFLAEVLVTWLMKVNISADKQTDLIETLLHELEKEPQSAFFIEFQYSARGAHDALIDMPLVLNLSKKVQEDIYTLIIRKNSGDDAKSRRARQEIVIFDFDIKTKYRLPGVQFAMEMLAETATPGDSITNIIGDETKLEESSVGQLMTHIADCEAARPYAGTNMLACAGVTSKRAIFEKIAGNSQILPVLRERARGLLGR